MSAIVTLTTAFFCTEQCKSVLEKWQSSHSISILQKLSRAEDHTSSSSSLVFACLGLSELFISRTQVKAKLSLAKEGE